MRKILFDKLIHINDTAYRNVVEVSADFSEIAKNRFELNAVESLLNFVGTTKTINPKDEFYYTTAIAYPFETDHYTISRYSDGSFPVWYGSLETETTIYETAYHMLVDEQSLENSHQEPIIYRDRVIYSVFCSAILIDLTGKEKQHPNLMNNTYEMTHDIGKTIHDQGHPGLISTSARCKGVNLDIFKQEVLSKANPKLRLSYEMNTKTNEIRVSFRDIKKRNMLIHF